MPAGAVVAPGRWPLGSSVSCGSGCPAMPSLGKSLRHGQSHGISMCNVHISPSDWPQGETSSSSSTKSFYIFL